MRVSTGWFWRLNPAIAAGAVRSSTTLSWRSTFASSSNLSRGADPELKTTRQYTNLSASEVRQMLIDKGYAAEQLPAERTMRDILNRMNYRLKRIQKGKPLKKTPETDAIFDNVHAAHAEAKDDPETLEISVDTKTKVKLGEYSMGGKKPD
jgi:hypothetical protein